jgi:hypothetical protein
LFDGGVGAEMRGNSSYCSPSYIKTAFLPSLPPFFLTWAVSTLADGMSGIEVAGIALAILPLIVNQLDSYVQGLETLGDLRTKRYRSKLDHYATNLGSQQASFINTLERSLEGVVEFDDGIDSLEPHEIKALWEKATVQRLLKKKLGRNYLPFMQTMKELSTLLEEIHRKLGWDKMPVEVCIFRGTSIPQRGLRANQVNLD